MLLTNQKTIIKALQAKQIGLIPTDTIYGLVALYSEAKAVKRIYQLKQRALTQLPIILVANWKQAKKLAQINQAIQKWEQRQTTPTTLILPKRTTEFQALKFWKVETVGLRIVRWSWLKTILRATGPLIATSCNRSGEKPLTTWKQLGKWRQKVDFSVKKTAVGKSASRIYDWKQQQFIR